MKNLLAVVFILTSAFSFAARSSPKRAAANHDQFIRTSGDLNDLVYANLSTVREAIGANWEVQFGSLECISRHMRGQAAGTCIVDAWGKTNPSSVAMFAILIGEADENGGMVIREVKFLKQNN